MLIVTNYKRPIIGSQIVYQTIQAPFHNYTIFSLQQLLYSCHGIPSSKHADSISSCTQVYPCSRYLDLCLSSLASIYRLDLCILILCRYVAIYSSLACQTDFCFTLGKLCQPSVISIGGLAMSHQYVFLASLICINSTLTFKLFNTQLHQWYRGAWLGLARSLFFAQHL